MIRKALSSSLTLAALLSLLGGLAAVVPATSARAQEPAAPKADTVEVKLSEYAVGMPASLPAGPTTFVIHNEGQKTHIFRIAGPGLASPASVTVRHKETGRLEITLAPGEYKIDCPIGRHAQMGMTLALAVTAPPAR